MINAKIGRRHFLQGAAALAVSSPMLGRADEEIDLRQRMYKTLKINMVKVKGDLSEKFSVARSAGFQGIEMNSPGMNVQETRRAIAASGLPVDGTVCSTHWQIKHTSADAGQRAKALAHLQQAIRDTHAVGGNTVLLVNGHGDDGPENDIWDRSLENIAKALPIASELGIYIAIENVWNRFLYDHDGGTNQTAEKYVKYVDQLDSPWVGMQFDIGNHWKYGNPADWIRELGRRIVKLDVKGFSRKSNSFTNIGAGDLPWSEVRRALRDINYTGWVAAEVNGGNYQRLVEVSANMDRVFEL